MPGPSPYGGTATRSNPQLHPILKTSAEAPRPGGVFYTYNVVVAVGDEIYRFLPVVPAAALVSLAGTTGYSKCRISGLFRSANY